MKKISLFLAAAGAILGMASCSQDRDPVLQTPTKYVLNTPVMQDQFIDLQEGNTLELVSSQPDYGYSAIAEYSAEMSLTEDFAESYALETTPDTKHLARFAIPQKDIAFGIMELNGITDEESFQAKYPDGMGYEKIYFRAVCQLAGIEGTRIVSNVVSYNNVKGYFAVAVPGYIYLAGAPEGWAGPDESNAAHYADWRLFEPADAIGSKVYSGVFDIPAGQAMFRFYTQLTGWDADSYGTQVDDNPIEYPELTDGELSTPLVKGKGSFSFPNWVGGKMTIIVDMSNASAMTVQFIAGEASVTVTKYIYLVGSISGWMEPGLDNEAAYKNFRLADTTGEGIYTGKFNAGPGHVNFRFALELTEEGWGNSTQIGSQADDADVPCSFTNGAFSGPYVPGKGNWAFDVDEAGVIYMTVDTNNQTVSYEFKNE